MAHTFPRNEPRSDVVSAPGGGMTVLGLALGALFAAGLYSRADAWLVWGDLAVAVLSLVAGFAPDRLPAFMKSTPMILGTALVALFVVGLAIEADAAMAWWTFAFALAYLLLGVGAALPYHRADKVSGSPML